MLLLTKLYFRECHDCGHMEPIYGGTYDEEKKIIVDPSWADIPDVYKKDHFCRICGKELQDSSFTYLGVVDVDEPISALKQRTKCIREYQKLLFEQYAASDEEAANRFHNREQVENDKYRAELREKRAEDPHSLRNILLSILLFVPVCIWIVARDLFGVFKKDLTDMMNAKGSTIVFWDDCNHHKK